MVARGDGGGGGDGVMRECERVMGALGESGEDSGKCAKVMKRPRKKEKLKTVIQ